jgi:small-conductance mechanosensitive channel
VELSRAWITEEVRGLLISGAVAIATATVLFWVRRPLARRIDRLAAAPGWVEVAHALRAALRPSPLWIGLLATVAALQVAPIPASAEDPIGDLLLTLLALSIGIVVIRLGRSLLRVLAERLPIRGPTQRVAGWILGVLFGGAVALVVLQVWGVPTAPLVLLLALLGVLALVSLRDLLPDLVASLQVNAGRGLAVGDYVKLEDGASGTIQELGWREAVLRSVDGARIRVPHRRLLRSTVTHDRPSHARARHPLRFVQRSHLRELTGLRARNLRELRDCLRQAPDASIYYHTHQYLEEHQYLVPAPSNAFAEWVEHELGLDAVAESLAAVNVLEMTTLAEVRERLAAILEAAIAEGHDTRTTAPGRELHFIRSITVVTPCPYQASTLPELAAVVRRLSTGSLFFHLFEARLLGGADAERDICNWIRRELDEPELAAEIGRFNPYDYTLEGLRETLLARVEARL